MYLIDSTTYINTLRAGKDPVREFWPQLELGMLCTCGVVICEVMRGLRDRAVYDRMDQFYRLVAHVEFDEALWRSACELAWRLDREGKALPLSDILIGTAAISVEAVVVTSDGHFRSIPGLEVRDSV